jgi:hypothetical protein
VKQRYALASLTPQAICSQGEHYYEFVGVHALDDGCLIERCP